MRGARTIGGIPTGLYRVQLRGARVTRPFTFADVGRQAAYLAGLGVSHVYLSPILTAAPGSTHGYDVVDHATLSADLGGTAGFTAMAAELARHGIGIVLDIVPNHMALPAPEWLNRQLWSVLAQGPSSRYAPWFDIDWPAGDGRLVLPLLGGEPADCAADLRVVEAGDGPVLRYYDHAFPLVPGTAQLPLAELLRAQHYRLGYWRTTEPNYRRFFDVSTLIGLRVEDPDVFRATHAVPIGLVRDGLVQGLRVDHIDGLADPAGYLAALDAATGGAWTVVEKVLCGAERLPAWSCAGTTGYDALRRLDGVFADPVGEVPLTERYRRVGDPDYRRVVHRAKHQVLRESLRAEVHRLVLAADEGEGAGVTADTVADLLAALPVYRTYDPAGPAGPSDSAGPGVGDPAREVLACAARTAAAGRQRTDLTALCALLDGGPAGTGRAGLRILFQQLSGSVMAKGVEDTAMYRWSRLLALNEVGGEPDRFAVPVTDFHAFAARLHRAWPNGLTTLSTHDTKRQEDLRARLLALAEHPAGWSAALDRWRSRADRHRPATEVPDGDLDLYIWQTIVGAWPIGARRLLDHLRKAMREAKVHTSWLHPDAGHERAVLEYAAALLDDQALRGDIAAFVATLAPAEEAIALGRKLVQLTMPGVPDVYQGCELTARALVDPDNRRPIDYDRRRARLAAVLAEPPIPVNGAVPRTRGVDVPATGADERKLLVTARALRLRRDRPGWFGPAAGYRPVAAAGPAGGHVLAFGRGERVVTVATRHAARLADRGGWRGTSLPLPPGRWRDELTGAEHRGDAPLAAVTDVLPVALLVREA